MNIRDGESIHLDDVRPTSSFLRPKTGSYTRTTSSYLRPKAGAYSRPTNSFLRQKTGSVIVPRPEYGAPTSSGVFNRNKFVPTERSAFIKQETTSYYPSYYPFGDINFNEQYQVYFNFLKEIFGKKLDILLKVIYSYFI